MKHYVYKDMKSGKILFESDEENSAKLTEVDVKYKKATGVDPKSGGIAVIVPLFKG